MQTNSDLIIYNKMVWTSAFFFLFALLMTRLTCLYARRKQILDIPNERSSHIEPTPRGGGLAIVISFLVATICLGAKNVIDTHLALALSSGGLVIAMMGYWDDIYTVQNRWRILIHFMVAIWALYCLGGFPALDLGTYKFTLNWKGTFIATIGIVWCINLYNFMDGIDGLAGSEGFFVSLAGGIALWLMNDTGLAWLLWLLAASTLGFTVWNWPPAKIFLGDVGSGFLGYVFAVICIHTTNKGSLPIIFWVLLLAVFLCDATFTVLARAVQGKRWYSPHREHAYQHLIQYGASHKTITLSILSFNMLVLMPFAFASILWPIQSFWLMSCAMICLLFIWLSVKSIRLQ